MNIFDLIISDKEEVALDDVFLDEENQHTIRRLIKEYRYIDELQRYGLPVNNKILLYGKSGCGKTTAAKAIAHALGKNINILNLSNIVCAKIGETSHNIKMVFDKAGREKSVLFLDEFDHIGKARDNDEKEVGEMKRLVTSLIQLIDYYPKNAILIGATNYPEIIDHALMRRFQLRIDFRMPPAAMLDTYYDKILAAFPADTRDIDRVYDISFAEAKDYAYTEVKARLIAQLEAREPRAELL